MIQVKVIINQILKLSLGIPSFKKLPQIESKPEIYHARSHKIHNANFSYLSLDHTSFHHIIRDNWTM